MKKVICPDLLSIWTHATTILAPIQQSINSNVTLTYPTVDRSKVNKRFLSNVPAPVFLPLHGCFDGFETIYERTDYGTPMNMGSKFTKDYPFGSALGYHTDAGPIIVPDQVFHGYKYDASQGWMEEVKKKQRTKIGRKTRRREGLHYHSTNLCTDLYVIQFVSPSQLSLFR